MISVYLAIFILGWIVGEVLLFTIKDDGDNTFWDFVGMNFVVGITSGFISLLHYFIYWVTSACFDIADKEFLISNWKFFGYFYAAIAIFLIVKLILWQLYKYMHNIRRDD